MFQSVLIESCDIEMFGRNPRIAFFRQPLELSWRGRVINNMPFIRMFFFANPCPIDSSLQLPVRRDWGSCIRPQRSGSHNLVSNAHKAENMTNKERRRRKATREGTQRLRKERFLPKSIKHSWHKLDLSSVLSHIIVFKSIMTWVRIIIMGTDQLRWFFKPMCSLTLLSRITLYFRNKTE